MRAVRCRIVRQFQACRTLFKESLQQVLGSLHLCRCHCLVRGELCEDRLLNHVDKRACGITEGVRRSDAVWIIQYHAVSTPTLWSYCIATTPRAIAYQ